MNRTTFLNQKKQLEGMIFDESSMEQGYQLRKQEYDNASLDDLYNMINSGQINEQLCKQWRLCFDKIIDENVNQILREKTFEFVYKIGVQINNFYYEKSNIDITQIYDNNPTELFTFIQQQPVPLTINDNYNMLFELIWAYVRDTRVSTEDIYEDNVQFFMIIFLISLKPDFTEQSNLGRLSAKLLSNILYDPPNEEKIKAYYILKSIQINELNKRQIQYYLFAIKSLYQTENGADFTTELMQLIRTNQDDINILKYIMQTLRGRNQDEQYTQHKLEIINIALQTQYISKYENFCMQALILIQALLQKAKQQNEIKNLINIEQIVNQLCSLSCSKQIKPTLQKKILELLCEIIELYKSIQNCSVKIINIARLQMRSIDNQIVNLAFNLIEILTKYETDLLVPEDAEIMKDILENQNDDFFVKNYIAYEQVCISLHISPVESLAEKYSSITDIYFSNIK